MRQAPICLFAAAPDMLMEANKGARDEGGGKERGERDVVGKDTTSRRGKQAQGLSKAWWRVVEGMWGCGNGQKKTCGRGMERCGSDKHGRRESVVQDILIGRVRDTRRKIKIARGSSRWPSWGADPRIRAQRTGAGDDDDCWISIGAFGNGRTEDGGRRRRSSRRRAWCCLVATSCLLPFLRSCLVVSRSLSSFSQLVSLLRVSVSVDWGQSWVGAEERLAGWLLLQLQTVDPIRGTGSVLANKTLS